MTIEILDDDGNVINRIVASAQFAGKYYPGQWRQAIPPEENAPEPQPVLTRLAFRNRFSYAEKVAIYEAAASAAAVRVFLDDLRAAEEIQLDDAATIEGVRALEKAGLLAAGRADEILASEPAPA